MTQSDEKPWIVHDEFDWIEYQPQKGGRYLVRDTEAGTTALVGSRADLARFIGESSHSSEHYRLGDMVHKLAKRLGFKTCMSCQERRAWLNRLIKKA